MSTIVCMKTKNQLKLLDFYLFWESIPNEKNKIYKHYKVSQMNPLRFLISNRMVSKINPSRFPIQIEMVSAHSFEMVSLSIFERFI